MNITNEQIEKLKLEIGESIFNEITKNEIEYDESKVYLYRNYILSKSDSGRYSFRSLMDYKTHANGFHNSAECLLKSEHIQKYIHKVKVFPSLEYAMRYGHFKGMF